MDGGDLKTDLGLLLPASAIRPIDSHAAHDHGEGKSRRRPTEEQEQDVDLPADAADRPEHEVDRLA